MTITSSGLGSKAIKTFALLDQIVTVLGTTKTTFFPFHNFYDNPTTSYEEQDSYGSGTSHHIATPNSMGARTEHVGGVCSYRFVASGGDHMSIPDHADFSFGNGTTTDAACSFGAWILMTEAVGTERTIIAKYDVAGTDREWEFGFDTSGYLQLKLYDDFANASEIGTGTTALTPNVWKFAVATYDGAQAAPDVHLYIDATDTLTAGTTTETGAYVAMQAGATPPLIGASDDSVAPTQEFDGRMALPFICGKELSAAEVTTLYGLGKTLLGI